MTQINGVQLYLVSPNEYSSCLNREQLSRLTLGFNERFPTWNLVVRTHCSLADRAFYALLVVGAISSFNDPRSPTDKEETEMRSFINGFTSAAKYLKCVE
jgi:hypothetical protein